MKTRSLLFFAAVMMGVVSSCDCGGGVTVGGSGGGSGTGGSGASGTGGFSAGQGGSGNGQGGAGGTGGIFDPDSGCAAVSSEARLGSKPVDIIMVIDNSGSMTEEIVGVQDNINANFGAILNDGGLDYRVVLLSRHGTASPGQSICITPPLSGNATCTPPAATPTNGPRFFHYNFEVSSVNALQLVTSRYTLPDLNGRPDGGYRNWLRPDAFKTIVVITDDDSSITPAQFETALFALTPQHFGTPTAKNYRLHSIIGLPYKDDAGTPYQPSEAVVSGRCPSGVNNGGNYQPLSRDTGGLRFPVCDPSKYNVVFQTIAQGVIAGARAACEFVIPPPPPGFTMFNRIIVNYRPMGSGAVQTFTKVANAGACGPTNYYVDMNKIFLCPQVCTLVQADMQAKVDVIFTCEPEIN